MRTSKKLVVSAVLAVGLLFGLALPASADPITVTSGTLQTILGDFDLTPGSQGTSPCIPNDPGPGNLDFTATGSATSGNWSVSGGYKGRFRLGTPPSGPWFQADFSFTGSSGTYNRTSAGPPPVYDLQGTLVANVRIYQITGPDCAKNNLQCVITGVFTITSGTFTGPLPTPTTSGSTALIDADTATTGFPLVTSSCGGAFAGVNGTDAFLVGLHLTVP